MNTWNLDWVGESEMFAPLRAAAKKLSASVWPGVALLNDVIGSSGCKIVNANGQRIRFVEQATRSGRFEDGFEPRTYLRGEVMMRPMNWHDLFNAMVWLTFPAAKSAINARHFAALRTQASLQRSAVGDALTMFDEDGLIVLSDDSALLDLIRKFRWKELFWMRRDLVKERMRFLIMGHAMYEKALHPFVGMTAKAQLFHVPESALTLQDGDLIEVVDQLLAARIANPATLSSGSVLAPVPVLGVPGWWSENESEAFYENARYFRSGRKSTQAAASS